MFSLVVEARVTALVEAGPIGVLLLSQTGALVGKGDECVHRLAV